MKIQMIKLVLGIALACLSFSCKTTEEAQLDNTEPPPEITSDTSLDEAVDLAIRYGGKTLIDTKKLIDSKKKWVEIELSMAEKINKHLDDYGTRALINAVHLYQVAHRKSWVDQKGHKKNIQRAVVIFRELVNHKQSLARQLGWQVASSLPSKNMALAIEDELTRSLKNGTEKKLLIPQMANAVQANRIKSAYTYIRRGLLESGHEDFVKAMISLDPNGASKDFLDYLALAPVEELRQITLKSVNIYSCMLILRHLVHYPAPVHHPKFEYLFLYSVSRNASLSEMASFVLESYFPKSRGYLAFVLARMPVWVQVAYVENARRRMSTTMGLFLRELKKTSPRPEVVEELNSVRL